MAFEIGEVHAHDLQKHGREILPALQHHAVDPFDKPLKDKLQQFGHLLPARAGDLEKRAGRSRAALLRFPAGQVLPYPASCSLFHRENQGVRVARPEKKGAT